MHFEAGLDIEIFQNTSNKLNLSERDNSPKIIGEIVSLEGKIDDMAKNAGIDQTPWQLFRHVMTDLRVHSPPHYTHGLRVGMYAHGIAKSEGHGDLKLPLFAGVGHDIGKVAVSREILEGERDFTKKDFEEVKQHVLTGYELLNSADFPFTAVIAGAHHFYRTDGKSYGIDPAEVDTLTNAEKFIASNMARIVMVADDFDARMTRRDYGNGQKPISFDDHIAQMSAEFPHEETRIDWLVANRL